MSESSRRIVISSEQVANYVVCPEAWRLKHLEGERQSPSERADQGKKLRKEWVAKQDLSANLRAYAKVIYLMVVLVTIVVFLLEQKRALSDGKRRAAQIEASSVEEASDTR